MTAYVLPEGVTARHRGTGRGSWFPRARHKMRRTSSVTVDDLQRQYRREQRQRDDFATTPILIGTRECRVQFYGAIKPDIQGIRPDVKASLAAINAQLTPPPTVGVEFEGDRPRLVIQNPDGTVAYRSPLIDKGPPGPGICDHVSGPQWGHQFDCPDCPD